MNPLLTSQICGTCTIRNVILLLLNNISSILKQRNLSKIGAKQWYIHMQVHFQLVPGQCAVQNMKLGSNRVWQNIKLLWTLAVETKLKGFEAIEGSKGHSCPTAAWHLPSSAEDGRYRVARLRDTIWNAQMRTLNVRASIRPRWPLPFILNYPLPSLTFDVFFSILNNCDNFEYF